MHEKIKKLFSILLVTLFTAGIIPADLGKFGAAEAKAKKKIYRKANPKKTYSKKIKKIRKYKKYKKPIRTGIITQKYVLEEGADEAEAENIVEEMRSLGAREAKVDIEKNTLQIKFDTKKLSAVNIIKRLKELGYTIKRID